MAVETNDLAEAVIGSYFYPLIEFFLIVVVTVAVALTGVALLLP